MRDKKVKRKNKQKEERFIQLKKQLDDYNFKQILPTRNRDYLEGFVSFFKNKEEFIDFFDFYNGHCNIYGISSTNNYPDYVASILIDIHFLNLKCSNIMYQYLDDYVFKSEPNEVLSIRATLAINLLKVANPNYILPKGVSKL